MYPPPPAVLSLNPKDDGVASPRLRNVKCRFPLLTRKLVLASDVLCKLKFGEILNLDCLHKNRGGQGSSLVSNSCVKLIHCSHGRLS